MWSLSKKSVNRVPLIYTSFPSWTPAQVPMDATLTQPTSILPAGSGATVPSTSEPAFLTLSGFKGGSSSAGISSHIYKTTNSASTWATADGGGGTSPLPDVPVLAMLADNADATGQSLFAGTDAGLFSSKDGGGTWQDASMGIIPHVPVFDLKQNIQGAIFVGTHGRGAYRLAPTAHFKGFQNAIESENGSCNSTYKVQTTVTPPPAMRDGDMLMVPIAVGEESGGDTPQVPSGWTLVPFSNQGGALSAVSSEDYCDFYETVWLAMHVYSSKDTTPYIFTASITSYVDLCGGCGGEVAGYLVSYRGADTNIAHYTANLYPNNSAHASTAGAISVGKFVNVLNIFSGVNENASGDPDSTGQCEQFSTVTGSPTPVTETPLTPTDCTEPPYLAADIWSGNASGSFGSYSTSPSGYYCASYPCPLPAWQVVIPAQPLNWLRQEMTPSALAFA